MENAMVDWKNDDEKTPEDYDSDVVSWVLKQGLRVGKVMLVTGILISSAPVVLPPLVVISAFGIAISVPYGVFLASYACSEKLMAFLLPKAAPPLMEEHRALTYEEEDDGNEEKDQEETKQVEPTRNSGERRLKMIGEENEIEETPRGDVLELEIKPTEGEEEKQRGETSEMETKSIKDEGGEKQSISEEDPVLKNEGSEEKPSEIEVIPVGFAEKKDQDRAKDIEIQQKPEKDTAGLVEQTGFDKEWLKEPEKKTKGRRLDQDVSKGVEDQGIASGVVLDKEMGPKFNETIQATEQKTDQSIQNKTMPDKKSHRKAKKSSKGSKQSTQNGSGTSPVEEVYSEKKIWDEINALRTIVGYKAPRLPSSMEELKALYRFTGVEPPASIKDPSDLAEVTDKLRSLMAIVGVTDSLPPSV